MPQKTNREQESLFVLELFLRCGLFCADAADYHIGHEIIFAGDGNACHASKHGNLSHVSQSIRNRSLKKLLYGCV